MKKMLSLITITFLNLIVTLNAEAACQGSSPSWTVAFPYTATDVQHCVNVAKNGDTIYIPDSDVAWNSTVTIPDTKGVEIIGSGVGKTKISGSASPKFNIQISADSSTFTRISGMEFHTDRAYGVSVVQTKLWGDQSVGRYRVDNCKFNYTLGIFTSGNAYGVVDNNEFIQTNGAVAYIAWFDGRTGRTMHSQNTADMGWKCWEDEVQFGTQYSHVWENNSILFDSWYGSGQYWTDAHAGGKITFRYNLLKNAGSIGGHDACSSYRRGIHSVEMYENTFVYTEYANNPNQSRGGSHLIYNNEFKFAGGFNAGPLSFPAPVYRALTDTCGAPWNSYASSTSGKICIKGLDSCNSDSDCNYVAGDSCVPLDGNSPSGYPARDQFGYTGNNMTQNPVIGWGNLYCSGSVDCTPNTHAAISWQYDMGAFVKYERDIIDYNTLKGLGSCNDGVDNDGNGLADMNDPTCIAFWDEKAKQRKNYTPLDYPHPLRDGVLAPNPNPPPATPENLRVLQ